MNVKELALSAAVAVMAIYATSLVVATITALGHTLGWDPIDIHGTLFWGCIGGLGLWGGLRRRSGK